MEQPLTGFEQRGLGLLIDNLCKFQCRSNLSGESQTPAQCDTLKPRNSPRTLLDRGLRLYAPSVVSEQSDR